MKHGRFDKLTRQLATSTSRRQALRTLSGAMLAGILSPILGDQAAWGRPRRCNCNEQCRRVLGEDSFCCNGVCCNGACCIDGICTPMYSQTCAGVPGFKCKQCKKGQPTICSGGGGCGCYTTIDGSVICARTFDISLVECDTHAPCQASLGVYRVCVVGECGYKVGVCANTAPCPVI
jgi:hypothetical protein